MHDDTCNSGTCYFEYVSLQDTNDFMGYQEWKRISTNTCVDGQKYGKELCGDIDRMFGVNSSGRF